MVELLPPAPAARVLFGLALAIFSFWSAAARRRMTARAPPGGGGESGRAPVLAPVAGGEFMGDAGRGEDCCCCFWFHWSVKQPFFLSFLFSVRHLSKLTSCCGSAKEHLMGMGRQTGRMMREKGGGEVRKEGKKGLAGWLAEWLID